MQRHASAAGAPPKPTSAGQDFSVLFDIDQTMGNFGKGSFIYQVHMKLTGAPPPIATFVEMYLARGAIRPWLSPLLKTLEEWKRVQRIGQVGIFTAASNELGWVSYLTECFEVYAATPGLFMKSDGSNSRLVFSREDSPLVRTASDGIRTVKDMSLVSDMAENVVLLDDKPDYAVNGWVIGVPEYQQDVCTSELVAWLKREIPTMADQITAMIEEDERKHPACDADFSGDDALWNAAQVLNRLFPAPQLT